MPALLPVREAQAAPKGSEYCFSPIECHKEMVGAPLCSSPGGCCVGDRCFVPESICQSVGDGMGYCYGKSPPISLTVGFGGSSTVLDIGDYLERAYRYGLALAAFLAAVMMVVGGFIYLTAGDSGRTSQGKEYIMNAVYGLAVALGAYVLLATVNPDLLKLQLPKVPILKTEKFVACQSTEHCYPCGVSYDVFVGMDGEMPSGEVCDWTARSGQAAPQNKVQATTCVGTSCHKTAQETGGPVQFCNASSTRCRLPAGNTRPVMNCGSAEGNTDGYICVNCLPDGRDCSGSGPNEDCCSGFCGDGKCSPGQPGDYCQSDKECVSGLCQTDGWNSCSLGVVGSPCDEQEECRSGNICWEKLLGATACTPGLKYSRCSSRCADGFTCDSASNMCFPTGDFTESLVCVQYGPNNIGCLKEEMRPGRPSSLVNCESAACPADAPYCNGLTKFCTDGSPGSPCKTADECTPQTVNWPTASSARMCVREISICTAGELGAVCDDGYDCQTGYCGETPKGRVCVSGKYGSRCGVAEGPNGPNRCDAGLVCRRGAEGYDRCYYAD